VIVPDEKWVGKRKDIVLGNVTLELHYLGPNHGLGNTVFILPSAKVAYIVDNVTPNRVGFTILPDFNIKEWERTLGEYLEMDFEKVIFSHSADKEPIKGGDKEDIAKMKQYIQDIRDGIHAEIAKGTNPFYIPSTLKLPKYKNCAFFDQWLEMNIWAVLLEEQLGPYLSRTPRMMKPTPRKSWSILGALFG